MATRRSSLNPNRRSSLNPSRRGPGTYIILIVAGAVTLIPFLYAILGSFKTTGQISTNPLGLPNPIVWTNYPDILGGPLFWQPLFNSILVAAMTTAIVLVCACLTAFILARIRFRGRESLYTFFTLGLLFPAAVAILPLYLMLRQLHLLDTLIGVALPQAAFGLPITIVILRPFFQSIPIELEDAAAIDGASRFRFFWRILLPMSTPVLVTVSILALIGSWNGYLLPLLVLTTQSNWTLPLGVSQFQSTYSADTAMILTYTILAMLPTIVAYAFGEKYIVSGLTSGAVKA